MSKSKIFRSAAILGAVVIIGAAAISAGATFAAAGGKHGGGQTAGSATLSVSPNPVPANTLYQVSGCGYVPGAIVTLNDYGPTSIGTVVTAAAADGCISKTDSANGPGTYTLKASTGSRNTVVASITFQVY